MAEPKPAHCPRCGKAILAGEVEGLAVRLAPSPVSEEDALVLDRYYAPLVQIRMGRVGGEVQVVESKVRWPGEGPEWVNLMPHRCSVIRGSE